MCVLVIDTYFAIFVGVLFSLIILPLVLDIIFCLLLHFAQFILLCLLLGGGSTLGSLMFRHSWSSIL